MTTRAETLQPSRPITSFAWTVILIASILPDILLKEVARVDTAWLFGGKLILLAALLAMTFVLSAIHPLRRFLMILMAIFLFQELLGRLGSSALWQGWFGGMNAPFSRSMLGEQLQRLGVSLLMIATLLILGFRRQQFFLALGDLKAPIQPVRWLGFPKPDSWVKFGGMWAIFITLGSLLFLVIAGRPSLAGVVRTLPTLPWVLLFAVLNAFNEEMTYRSSLLAGLGGAVAPPQAVYMAAAFFGIGHFYGVPYGVTGVILAGFLGWMLGKAMQETHGFFWAWFIHFMQDVVIFYFMAMGSVMPGG